MNKIVKNSDELFINSLTIKQLEGLMPGFFDEFLLKRIKELQDEE